MIIKSLITQVMLIVTMAAFLTGCSSIMNGRTEKVPIYSNPPGATIYLNGSMVGFTPTTINLDRKETHDITLVRDGYQATSVRLRPRLSAYMLGNALPGAAMGTIPFACLFIFAEPAAVLGICAGASLLVGGVIDVLSGGGYCLSPSRLNIPLQPIYR